MTIFSSGSMPIDHAGYEVVERKGKGHPDTICDAIAENISRAFSEYTLNEWGVILRHMLDKIALQGGSSRVSFGGGRMLSPAKIYLNGRFTREIAGKKIPYLDIAQEVVKREVEGAVPRFDTSKWLKIVDNIHFSQGPGVVYESAETANERQFFFTAPEMSFLQYHSNSLRSNDTSTSVGYAPLSVLERAVLMTEEMLNTPGFKKGNPFAGSDIKVMGIRMGRSVKMTCCVPLISHYVVSESDYHEKLRFLQGVISEHIQTIHSGYSFEFSMNTRDSAARSDFYLTLTGSAIESGDEGVVGRGNRVRGIIPFTRRMGMEAPCGKNPVYHVGKVYTALGTLIAEKVHAALGCENYIYITSQIGQPLAAPWHIGIDLCNAQASKQDERVIQGIVNELISSPDAVTRRIIRGEIRLF